MLHADVVTIHRRERDFFYRTAESSPVDIPTVETLLDYHRRVLDQLETLVVSSVDDPAVDVEQRAHLTALGIAAYVGVPLGEQERALGILFVNQKTPRCWTDNEVRLIQTFARQIASALHSALLLRETRERLNELEGVSQMSELTASLIHEKTLVELALQLIKEILDVEMVAVHLLDESGERLGVAQTLGANPLPAESVTVTPLIRSILESHQVLVRDPFHQSAMHAALATLIRMQAAQALVMTREDTLYLTPKAGHRR